MCLYTLNASIYYYFYTKARGLLSYPYTINAVRAILTMTNKRKQQQQQQQQLYVPYLYSKNFSKGSPILSERSTVHPYLFRST